MRVIYYILSFFFVLNVYADSFEKGSGAEYNLVTDTGKNKLSIYISNSSFTELGVEYFFITGQGILKRKLWQQYIFKLESGKNLGVSRAYVQASELEKPQELLAKHIKANKGVRLDQFMFNKKTDIDKFLIGNELIEVAAGSIRAAHYRKIGGGQTVDFWISEQAKPIGLIKLISKSSKNPKQNYNIELSSLLKNVKAMIKPKEAIPLTKDGKALFNIP